MWAVSQSEGHPEVELTCTYSVLSSSHKGTQKEREERESQRECNRWWSRTRGHDQGAGEQSPWSPVSGWGCRGGEHCCRCVGESLITVLRVHLLSVCPNISCLSCLCSFKVSLTPHKHNRYFLNFWHFISFLSFYIPSGHRAEMRVVIQWSQSWDACGDGVIAELGCVW